MSRLHVIQRLYLAEELIRRRRADETRRHAASQRSAKIDPNPHQIDAVTFALARISDGGCILADEVGLGKTIEAGLVVAQLLAEGAQRVLVITPKALLGQWRQELFSLFGIDGHEVATATDLGGSGVFLATRDLMGSEAGAEALRAAVRFDLCVIDEAHEVFAGIYKRFDRHGALRDDAPHARMAGRVSQALRESGTPLMLLTATPIQNSLLELWGLVHYIDPTGTLLGDVATFQDLFCPQDARVLMPGQEHELQRRLSTVLKRTLRRQAQEFMLAPFMARQARLYEYPMSAEERALYDDVTNYLLEPYLHAFRGRQRKLLLLGFHRRMASSQRAFAASLEKVADRLRRTLDELPTEEASDVDILRDDLEDDDVYDDSDDASSRPHDAAGIAAELARVETFIARARALPTDSKARALLSAVRLVIEQSELGNSNGKVVIFTESLTTQQYLRSLLSESGLVRDEDITLFNGSNDSPRAAQALDRWFDEVGRGLDPASRPSPAVAVRIALMHEFQHRSRILISTEAGAKGLNLQFCDTVVNYDLPWNPQRIEQRIGRCHRYGQQRDVTVVNFIAKDNEAQRLTFEILSQKLDLFGTVLGATDEVLHRPGETAPESLSNAFGAEFESQLRRIYERARTIDEVERELRELRDTIASKRTEFDAAQRRTEDVIRSRFDSSVRHVFARIQEELPHELAEFDDHVRRVVTGYLEAVDVPFRLRPGPPSVVIEVEPSPRLPDGIRDGIHATIGGAGATPLRPLHLGHPLVAAAIDDARRSASESPFRIRVVACSASDVARLRGQRGRLRLIRVTYNGFEITEQIVPVAVLDGTDQPLPVELARALLKEPIAEAPDSSTRSTVTDSQLDDAVDEMLFSELADAGRLDHGRFEQSIEQVERFVADRILLLERQRDAAIQRLARGEVARDVAVGSEQRDRAEAALRRAQSELERLEVEIARLRAGDDDQYRHWRERARDRRYARPSVVRLVDAELEIS